MQEEVEKWRLAAAEWLDLQEAADLLHDTKADVFAEICDDMPAETISGRQHQARLSTRWKKYRDETHEAVCKARRAKFRVKYVEMMFEAKRTESANARAERNMG